MTLEKLMFAKLVVEQKKTVKQKTSVLKSAQMAAPKHQLLTRLG